MEDSKRQIKMYVTYFSLYIYLILNCFKYVYRLVCCNIKGHINSFFDYIERMMIKKGLFDYIFCIGDFFGDDEEEWEHFKKSGKICKSMVCLSLIFLQ